MRQGDIDASPSPTPQPQSIEDIFEGIFGDDSDEVFTTSQVDDGQYSYGYTYNASPSPTLNATKSPKIFAGNAGKTSKSKLTKTYKSSLSMSMECSKSKKASSMSYGKKSSSEQSSVGDGSFSYGSYEIHENKSSQSMKTKTTKVCAKSGKGLSYSIVEGKADKGGDDPGLMILEQMRFKMGNGGRRSGGVELLLMMTSIMMVSSYLVW